MLRMPGAILMTRLKVYDTAAPDGQRGGTPHVHLTCTEMYVVLGGTGAVEMIDANGFSRVALRPHDALLFSPGTIHRLMNPDGDLEILAIMQNSGLPERGDNIVCFAGKWLESDERFAEAMHVTSLEEAYCRRDRGVEGWLRLKATFDDNLSAGRDALRHFYRQAAERTAQAHAQWEQIVQQGAAAEAQHTLNQLQALQNQDLAYLMQSQHHLIATDETPTLGFCGHLNRYFDPSIFTPEGLSLS